MILNSVLKLLATAIYALHRRAATVSVALIGIFSVYYMLPRILAQPALFQLPVGLIILIFPLLLLKAIVFSVIMVFDLTIIFGPGTVKAYDVNLENVRARIGRILIEKNLEYQSLDQVAHGFEHQLLFLTRSVLRFNYPEIMLVVRKPFMVIKMYKIVKNKAASIKSELTESDNVKVKIMSDNSPEARVLDKYIYSYLDATQNSKEAAPDLPK